MDNSQLELTKLKWSTAYFTVSELLNKYPLPQIVKVIGGFYGETNESTLSTNQVLCLHSVKSIEKVHGRDSCGKEISMLLECRSKVEVCSSNLKDVYESVEELCSAFPRYVRVSQGYYSTSTDEEILNVGDKLHLKSIDKSKKRDEKLICVNQNGRTIELPKDCVADFQPLADGKEYYLSEVLKEFSMPLYVQFVEPYSLGHETWSENRSLSQSLGTICLDRMCTETVITATSIRIDGQHATVQFSPEVDIRLVVCEELFRNSADYVNICQSFNQGTDYQSINTDTNEYIDTTQNLKDSALNVASKSGSKKLKKGVPHSRNLPKPDPAKAIPPRLAQPMDKPAPQKAKPAIYPKPKTKNSTSKHDAKIAGNLTSPIHKHNESFQTSKHQQTSDEVEQPYADPNAIYEEIGCTEPKYTECQFVKDSTYTALDPTYISNNRHEYAKLNVEHLTQSNPVIVPLQGNKSQRTSEKQQPTESPSHLSSQLSTTSDSNQPAELGRNFHVYKYRNAPQVPDKPSRLNRSAMLTNPHLPANAIALPNRLVPKVPDSPPQLPSRVKIPNSEPGRSTTHEIRDKLPDIEDHRPNVSDSKPELPTSLPGRRPSLPSSKMPAVTPEQRKEEIYQAIAKYPLDLSRLSVADVGRLLEYLGMGNYVEIFVAELIDGVMLASMDRENLESLNISPFHVTKLLKFIGGWRPNVQRTSSET